MDPDELVWASEIASRTGRSRQSIDMLIRGRRGPGDFPAPASHATRNPLWRWSEVDAWFAAYEGRAAETERSAVIGAINRLEIWDSAAWQRYLEEHEESYAQAQEVVLPGVM